MGWSIGFKTAAYPQPRIMNTISIACLRLFPGTAAFRVLYTCMHVEFESKAHYKGTPCSELRVLS